MLFARVPLAVEEAVEEAAGATKVVDTMVAKWTATEEAEVVTEEVEEETRVVIALMITITAVEEVATGESHPESVLPYQ